MDSCVWNKATQTTVYVDRTWRKAIDKITDKEIGALTYYNLRVLMEETDKSKFEELLRKTLEQLKSSNTTQDFFAYFMKYYVDRKEQWAACYRIKSGINTNMYVESFHRVLKHIYLKGRSNKCVDRLLHVLMKLARDKGFERLCKLEKGKITGRLAKIRQRHFESIKLSREIVSQCTDKVWSVTSSDGTQEYTVCLESLVCSVRCKLQCDICKICVHLYSCNCNDALINHTICKHVHLVASCYKMLDDDKANGSSPTNQSLQQIEDSCTELCSQDGKLLEGVLKPTVSQHTNNDIIKNRAKRKLTVLMSKLQAVTNTDALVSAESHIDIALSLLNVLDRNIKNTPMIPTELSPSNKHITQQRSFFSTKRKHKKCHTRIRKPSKEKRQQIQVSLLSDQPLYLTNASVLQLQTREGFTFTSIHEGINKDNSVHVHIM